MGLTDGVSSLVCRPIFQHEPWMDWALCLTLSLPHFLYAWIWFNPNQWRDLIGKKKAVETFAFISTVGKLIQFEAFLLWVWSARPSGLCFTFANTALWQWMAFLLLIAFGQKLNIGIYQAIGISGVYYGFKLGKRVPWVTGFPFNVVSHPQYVGSAMSVWGACTLLYSQMPAGSPLQISVVVIAAYWTALYVLTGIIEQYT